MFTVHATRKLLDRVPPVGVAGDGPAPDGTQLGSWYATVLFWRPQVALVVNERTLLPVLVPLAPAKTLLARFPAALGAVLEGLGMTRGSWPRNSLRWSRAATRRRRTGAWSG